jgi:hypothetical protein
MNIYFDPFGSSAAGTDRPTERPGNTWLLNPRAIQNKHATEGL